MFNRSLTGIAFVFMICLFTSCSNSSENPSNANLTDTVPAKGRPDKTIPGGFSQPTSLRFDSTMLISFLDSFPGMNEFKAELTSFYQKRNYSYAWFNESGMIEPAGNLYNRLQNIAEEGVKDTIPYKIQFTRLMEADMETKSASAMLDLMLTAQYLHYSHTVWNGMSEKETKAMEWLLPRKQTSYAELLDSLISGKNILANEPVYRQYNLLKDYLKKYNAIKANGGWPTITADKKTYKAGDSSELIKKVRNHLFINGDLASDNQSAIFDSTMVVAIKDYERRMGYKQDGILTATLIAEMNKPVEKRIQQIIVNMERSRWVPVKVDGDYLLVNIPDYTLYVYENDSIAFSMNVVVGKDQNKTVIFNGDMKYIVFSPYWNIPASILKKEVLPGIRRNPNYLARHNMEWNGGNVRQKPGLNNSLGLVKFLFPNSHSIYLHDTPSKSLFNEDLRAFSHGCIRLAEPKKLAIHLLRNDASWTDEKITAAMNAGKEQTVTLKKPIPVFIVYFTSWVDRKGKLNFRNDIYKRDQNLADMIFAKNK